MVNCVASVLTLGVMSVEATPVESPTLNRLRFLLNVSPIAEVSSVIVWIEWRPKRNGTLTLKSRLHRVQSALMLKNTGPETVPATQRSFDSGIGVAVSSSLLYTCCGVRLPG